VALTWPLALLLALGLVPAVWLTRRAGGRTIAHPLWFLAPAGRGARRRRGGGRWRVALTLAAIAAAALAAAGPVVRAPAGDRVLVVDLSATRALDVAAVRARAAGYDRVVLAAPGAPPRIIAGADAAAAIAPTRGTTDAATLAAAVAAGMSGSRTIDVAAAPAPGADVGITALAFLRDPLAAARGQLIVEVATPAGACDRAVAIADGDRVLARVALTCAGGRGVAAWRYDGAGGVTLTVRLDPAGADALAVDDAATIAIPALAPTPVWIAPALTAGAVAQALAALPTVTLLAAPRGDAIAVVPPGDRAAPGRAQLVIHAPPPTARPAALVLMDRAPLPGVTPPLLAATGPVPVDVAAGAAAAPANTWLRAGAAPAVWDEPGAVHVAVALDGPALPVLLADLFARAPLAPAAPPPALADVRAPPPAPAAPPPRPRSHPWPLTALFIAVAVAVAAEAALARPRGRAALALRGATLVAALLGARATTREPRRVVFVLDVSASVAPAEATARAALAREADALGADDRAALVLVAGGATVALPPGPPAAVAAWARRGPIDAAARGLDPATTELRAGVQLAATLARAGDVVALITDGRDRGGAAALAGAPGLIGRGVVVTPIDTGDRGRIEARAATAHAAPGQPVALPVAVELRVAAAVTIVASHRGVEVGRVAIALAAGTSIVAVPVTLPTAGVADVELALAVPDDPIALGDRARIEVEVGAAARRLDVTAATVGALHPTTLADVDEVWLDDVAPPALTAAAAAALDDFVRAGGTLAWIAGPATAAAGPGPIAPLLPLRPAPPPRLALMLVIDRSGSIGAPGAVAVGPAEVAAAAALAPTDYVGALAFDVAPVEWVAFGPAGAGVAVRDLPPPRGGTDPAAAITAAVTRLAAAPADARAIIALVSDGGFPATLDAAVRAAAAAAARGIRVETFATGAVDAAGAARLCQVASAGQGSCHRATTDLAIVRSPPAPSQRVGSLRARRDGPTVGIGAPIAHLALAPTADATVLADAGDDPLLALRPHGAGRVVAWAADRRAGAPDAAIADAHLAAAVARPAGAAVTVRPTDAYLEVMVANADAVPVTGVASGAAGATPLVFAPTSLTDARAEVPISASVIVAIAGARSAYVAPDPEHRGLGVTPGLPPSSPARVAALRRPARRAVWLAALSILLMLATLSLPETPLVTARDIAEDDQA
jgi:hypothetical protein